MVEFRDKDFIAGVRAILNDLIESTTEEVMALRERYYELEEMLAAV